MFDREKVIKGLECCEHPYAKKCDACPYDFYTPDSMECTAYLCKDALALLREQEPIGQIVLTDLDIIYRSLKKAGALPFLRKEGEVG